MDPPDEKDPTSTNTNTSNTASERVTGQAKAISIDASIIGDDGSGTHLLKEAELSDIDMEQPEDNKAETSTTAKSELDLVDANADSGGAEIGMPKKMDDEKPCHSRSQGGSCDSTSGIGTSNGSGSNSSNCSSSSSTTATSSSIKKRSNSSHRRNYRTSHPQIDSETSNDNDSGVNQSQSQGTVQESADNEESSNDEDLPLNKYKKTEKRNRRGTPESQNDQSALDSSDTRDTAEQHDDSSRHSSTPFALSDSDEDAENGAGNGSQHSETRRQFEGFFNVYHRDSSDSDSSMYVPELEEESSSSSSDNFLEDIDERPAESSRPTSVADDLGSSSETPAVAGKTKGDGTTKTKKKPKARTELPSVLKKKKPPGDWCGPKELFSRELGLSGKKQPQSSELFRSKFYGSLFSAERLELMTKIDGHEGCVNCLNFNHSGTKLASGSDDLMIKLWNYSTGQCLTSFRSGHKANVFQAKFLPLIGLDTMIVSCARDSQVRLTELNSSGGVCSSKKIVQHHGPAHKLTINPDTPHVVLSCGEDGLVYSIDIRDEKPERLVKVMEKGKRISLYSIHQNPFSPHEFCVSGRDQYVRIYDSRKLTRNSVNAGTDDEGTSAGTSSSSAELAMKKFCPHHLTESQNKTNVTAAVYNYNGREILGSYNDENIYLFDATHSDMADCVKVYEGHRNNATVKGVNFFGDKSQFVVSGSDCGHIFIWDKETESIVNFQRGDETGVVNCLEGHPTAPILATSGLDHDIKIWIPSNEKSPQMGELKSTVHRNLKGRADDLKNQPQFDQNVMWALWNHIRRSERIRGRGASGENDDDDSDNSDQHFWSDDDDDDDEEGPQRGVDCSIM